MPQAPRRGTFRLLLCLWLGMPFLMPVARAQSDNSTHPTPTFFFHLGVGISTYKSTAVLANDTGFTSGYKFGTYAGANHSLELAVEKDLNTTAFVDPATKAKSKIETSFEKTTLDYRWEVLSFGFTINQMTLVASRSSEPYLDAYGSGFGGHLNLLVPYSRNVQFFLDMAQLTHVVSKEIIQSRNDIVTSLGPVTELMVGSQIKITRKALNLHLAYKQRAFALKVGDENLAELQTMMWIALAYNSFF